MRVKNLIGTSGKKCNCGSWITHWENETGKKIDLCAHIICTNKAEVGAHVKIEGSNSNTYIVPLCHRCNHLDSYMEIGSTLLARANVADTCGYK